VAESHSASREICLVIIVSRVLTVLHSIQSIIGFLAGRRIGKLKTIARPC
jgi:hypothetical protein